MTVNINYNEKKELQSLEIKKHIKEFLEKGGEVIKIPYGKSSKAWKKRIGDKLVFRDYDK